MPLPLPLSTVVTAADSTLGAYNPALASPVSPSPAKESQSGHLSESSGPILRVKKQIKKQQMQTMDQLLRSAFQTLQAIQMPKVMTGWWHSFRAIQMRYTKSPGLLVWCAFCTCGSMQSQCLLSPP